MKEMKKWCWKKKAMPAASPRRNQPHTSSPPNYNNSPHPSVATTVKWKEQRCQAKGKYLEKQSNMKRWRSGKEQDNNHWVLCLTFRKQVPLDSGILQFQQQNEPCSVLLGMHLMYFPPLNQKVNGGNEEFSTVSAWKYNKKQSRCYSSPAKKQSVQI